MRNNMQRKEIRRPETADKLPWVIPGWGREVYGWDRESYLPRADRAETIMEREGCSK